MPLFIDDFLEILKVLLLICEIYSVEKWKLEKQKFNVKKKKNLQKIYFF